MRNDHIPFVFRSNWNFDSVRYDIDDILKSRWGAWKTGTFESYHCYTDDYRFEPIWNKPELSLKTALEAEFVIAPDFSLYEGAPDFVNQWQLYRSNQVYGYWRYNGVFAIPSASWTSTYIDSSFLPQKSVIAVRGPSAKDIQAWSKGAEHIMKTCKPIAVLHFGLKLGIEVWKDVGYSVKLRNK